MAMVTRHSKKDARYSSDSVGSTSGAGTSESPEKWKDEELGLFPNPKGEYTEFSNSILPKFYLSFWTTCPYNERRCFVTERKRQWEVREALKAVNLKLAFVTCDNPAAAGRFLEEIFSAKRHDATTIRNNNDDLSEVETDSQSGIVDRVVGSSPSSSSDESSPETDFLPEPGAETLPTSKHGRKRARVERNNYVSWDKTVF